MDIFINGKQGAGKTRTADAIIKANGLTHFDTLYIGDKLHSVRLTVEMLRHARVRAVIFDGGISNGGQLLMAVQAVKEFREQVNADVLAIYVQQAELNITNVPAVAIPMDNDAPNFVSKEQLAELDKKIYPHLKK